MLNCVHFLARLQRKLRRKACIRKLIANSKPRVHHRLFGEVLRNYVYQSISEGTLALALTASCIRFASKA
jgi:hypothetical protein